MLSKMAGFLEKVVMIRQPRLVFYLRSYSVLRTSRNQHD